MKKLLSLLIAVLAVPCASMAAPIVNTGSYFNVNWTTQTTFGGYGTTTATGGTAPSISGGNLTTTSVGSTGGFTEVRKQLASPTYPILTDYVLTLRAAVPQFSATVGTANNMNMTFFDVLGYDRLRVGLDADKFLVAGPGGGTAVSFSSLGLSNTAGTFYTWQFEVTQDTTSGRGTVDVYRRDNDTGASWSTIVENAPLLNYTTTPSALITYFNKINYDASGEGIMQQKYFMIAEIIPEPSSALLLLGGAGMLALRRRAVARR